MFLSLLYLRRIHHIYIVIRIRSKVPNAVVVAATNNRKDVINKMVSDIMYIANLNDADHTEVKVTSHYAYGYVKVGETYWNWQIEEVNVQ